MSTASVKSLQQNSQVKQLLMVMISILLENYEERQPGNFLLREGEREGGERSLIYHNLMCMVSMESRTVLQNLLELELQASVSCPMQVVRSNSSPAQELQTLLTISLAQLFYYLKSSVYQEETSMLGELKRLFVHLFKTYFKCQQI